MYEKSNEGRCLPKRQVSIIQYTMRSLYIHFATVGPSAYFNRYTARDVNTINTQSHTETAHASRRNRPRKGSQTTKNGFRRHWAKGWKKVLCLLYFKPSTPFAHVLSPQACAIVHSNCTHAVVVYTQFTVSNNFKMTWMIIILVKLNLMFLFNRKPGTVLNKFINTVS